MKSGKATLRKINAIVCVYFVIVFALYVLLLTKRIDTIVFLVIKTILMVTAIMLFIRWWIKDYAAKERVGFINRAIRHAVSSNPPEDNIKTLIRYLGKELGAMRIFIFEDQKNGKYHGTYEWFDESLESASLELTYLPYSGLVDKVIEEFEKNNHRLIIKSPRACRDTIPSLYELIKSNDIDNMVLGPLEVNGNIFGIFAVINVPEDTLFDIAEIITLLSYFITQLILQREELKRNLFYSYNDTLTGAYNNIAFKRFVDNELDKSAAFGYLRCDLIGLLEINVSQGYEVGDMLVVLLAKSLMEVFGEKNVYRMSGTEFVAFGFETDEVYFNNDVERVKKLVKEKEINVSFAPVYCMYGTSDISVVIKRADNLRNEVLSL